MPEKLLSIREVAEYLNVSEDEVKRLVDIGELPAYSIGGTFLRFRKEQVDAVLTEISTIETAEPEHAKAVLDSRDKIAHPYTQMEKEIKRRQPAARQYDYTFLEKVRDFFYFNDFYILCLIIVGVLIYIIYKS